MSILSPKAITFDCAQTLVDVRWTPERSVATCARTLGLDASDSACSDFGRLFRSARGEYEAASLTRDPAVLREFWLRLHAAWLASNGLDSNLAEQFVSTAEGLIFSRDGLWFRPYPDVRPCVGWLRAMGFRLGVISNWDNSLHAILAALDLSSCFDVVVASLEEGMEKPDPALFALAADRLGVTPSETLHVGDDLTDDVIGARAAGMQALHLDRTARESRIGVIRSLDELFGVLAGNP